MKNEMDSFFLSHLKGFIESFVAKEKVARYLLLVENQKGRDKIFKRLPHFYEMLRRDRMNTIPKNIKNPFSVNDIVNYFSSFGAKECVIFRYDGIFYKKNILQEKLCEDSLFFMGIVSSVPGELALYLAEDFRESVVLSVAQRR
ncbi:MAG: hypothetical protein LBQ20_08920 [Rhodanobacter sp.]|jgi:hypothetical protein|nr:hypothetical protein [Rhodanobacter sp.]